MKLTLIHLALIVIGVLMLVNLGYSVKEGMKSKKHRNNKKRNDEDKDKYILKTQIVPPVCPKCPDVTVCPNNSNAPSGWVPSPFANRDYNSQYNVAPGPITSAYEPRPILTDFSQF